MAEKRMFAKTIIDSDAFLEMPVTSQLLYFHLSMRADDDGFINKPKAIMKMIGANTDDIKILFAKKFVIPFDSGVVVIKHWRINNYIRNDTHHDTTYTDEMAMLELDANNAYTLKTETPLQIRNEPVTQISIDKNSLDKNREDKDIYCPVRQEIISYLNDKTSSRYRDSKSTKRLIDARLKEGYTIEDFKTVIDKKCGQWLTDSQMAQYLRPETLFNATHFESYLNEVDPWEKAKEMYGSK